MPYFSARGIASSHGFKIRFADGVRLALPLTSAKKSVISCRIFQQGASLRLTGYAFFFTKSSYNGDMLRNLLMISFKLSTV